MADETPGRVASTLTEIRERYAARPGDVERLLAAVDAALKLTEPGSEVHRDLDGNEEGGVVRVVRCDVLREAITAALTGTQPSEDGGDRG